MVRLYENHKIMSHNELLIILLCDNVFPWYVKLVVANIRFLCLLEFPLAVNAVPTTPNGTGTVTTNASTAAIDPNIADQLAAQAVIDKRVVAKTKRTYATAIRKFQAWLAAKYPEFIETVDGRERIKIPLSEVVVLGYLACIQRSSNGKLKAHSTMVGISSAIYINDLYRDRGTIAICPNLKARVNTFMRGHKRMVAAAKESGELPLQEGKGHITFEGFVALATYALCKQDGRPGSMFPHLFITLSWNLFSRSHSVASLMYVHIGWESDALVITVPRHKGDQEGARIYPIHVYANPLQPEVCPILSLAIYIFTMGYHRSETGND